MDKNYSQAVQNPRERKLKHKGIDKLSDDMLIAILSCMNFKEAARTSLLSRRWRYLWMLTYGKLEFEGRYGEIRWKEFKARVNRVLKLHQAPHVDSFVVRVRHAMPRLGGRFHGLNSWIYFAIQKEVKRFELDVTDRGQIYTYQFPSIDKLLSRTHEFRPAFGSLRSLRLVYVQIEDEAVQYFLASCPCLEQLCIRASQLTKNLQVVDPLPNLRVLEISKCYQIQSLEVSVMNLVSLTYDGNEISLPFKSIPNVSELSLGGVFCQSFMLEPNQHSSYSVQLVKLAVNLGVADIEIPQRIYLPNNDLLQLHSLKLLEVNIVSQVGRSLLFFASLIESAPVLHEFRIKISYMVDRPSYMISDMMMFPETWASAVGFRHKNLKKVELSGYIGCSSDEAFVLDLFKLAPFVEMVVIDTQSEYYEDELWDCSTMCHKREGVPCICERDPKKILEIGSGARTSVEAKERAKKLELSSPPKTVLVIT